MGFELSYDAFVGLTFGFFVAFVTVRMSHEVANGVGQLRRQRQRRRDEGE